MYRNFKMSDHEDEHTIAEDLVVTKYKMAGEIVNRECRSLWPPGMCILWSRKSLYRVSMFDGGAWEDQLYLSYVVVSGEAGRVGLALAALVPWPGLKAGQGRPGHAGPGWPGPGCCWPRLLQLL